MNVSKLPIELKNYRAPRWYDRPTRWAMDNWHWILGVGYFGAVYFGGSHV